MDAELLQAVLDSSPSGFYIVDADLRISRFHAESQARAFRNVDHANGRRLEDTMRMLWPEPLATEIIGQFRHTLHTGEPYVSPGLVAKRADTGVTECYDWQLRRITMPDGRHAVVCHFYNATRLRHAELELRESDRRKDQFLAMLGHELRNPLAPMRNGIHYFRRLLVGDAQAESIQQMMERQFNHLVRLVDDLMEVSRINRGKVELRVEHIELESVLLAAVETSRPLIEECGHQLEVKGCTEPLRLRADAVRLTQVLANLLNNAAKYTPCGGNICLAAWRAGADVQISVRDDGMGIPQDMLGRIFDPFIQIGGGGDRAQGGLGIGLTLVRSIVGLHGGRVEARSEGPGRGCEFLVCLPLPLAD